VRLFRNEFEIDTSVTTSTLILKLNSLLVAGDVDGSVFVIAPNASLNAKTATTAPL
jgi:hypothetical protein